MPSLLMMPSPLQRQNTKVARDIPTELSPPFSPLRSHTLQPPLTLCVPLSLCGPPSPAMLLPLSL
jgi:hypothetical protein